jgi:hypothetical protein
MGALAPSYSAATYAADVPFVLPLARGPRRDDCAPPSNMRVSSIIVVSALAIGCGLPRDPDNTLDHVRGGTMRVGVAIHPPWTSDSAGTYGGIEPGLVRALARELDAEVVWRPGGESVLLPQLHERKLDVVVAGLDAGTPWAKQVGITRPYHSVSDPEGRELVWAVAPGENAWQMRVEHFLRAQRPNIEAMKRRLAPEARRR